MKIPLTGARRSRETQESSDWTSGDQNDGWCDSSSPTLLGSPPINFGGLFHPDGEHHTSQSSVPSPSESASAESVGLLQLERTVLYQQKLFALEKIAHENLVQKLWKLGISGEVPGYENLRRCGSATTVNAWCQDCGHNHEFKYQCCQRWCPLCAGKKAYERQKKIRLWVKQIKQPKHIVVTARNTTQIEKKWVRQFEKALLSLRRSILFKKVKGGCTSMEVTNESRGWHLHAHMLVDVRWLDSGELAKEWAWRIGQDFAIVKVQDGRGKDYAGEVAKYVVKGNAIASWAVEEIVAFIKAFKGVRTFTRFGSLRGKNEYIDACLAASKKTQSCKKCGSDDVEMTFGVKAFLKKYRMPE